jgi:hypothetical protein
VGRKTEQEIHIDSQIRFWEGKQRKCRTTKQQIEIAKILKDLRAERWPNPVDEAKAEAAATKLAIKKQRLDTEAAKKTELAELERQREIERQKVRDEENPVIDHLKRAVIRAEIREKEEKRAELTQPEVAPVADEAPVTSLVVVPDGVSPELAIIERDAEASAKRNSTNHRDVLLDLFKKATQPLESGDVMTAPSRRYVADSESSGPGETYARLGTHNNAPPAEPVDGGYLAEWNAVPKKW